MKRLVALILVFVLSLTFIACEKPHEHEFINGECSCGEKHNCEFVDGKCECGKFEEKHEHNFVDGKCECGEVETSNPSIKDDFACITIKEALEKAKAAGETGTSEEFYIYGVIKEVQNSVYGAMTITDGTDEIYVYGVNGEDRQTQYSNLEDKPVKGDEVVLLGK